MDAEKRNVVLGDCVTAPPGFDQPLVFETVERAMASPGGRGDGDYGDDVYALGVALAIALIGRNPLDELSEEELIAAKVEHGTYAVLCSRERIPASLVEPLRGMLGDDRGERWGLDELSIWLRGDNMPPIQRKSLPRASIPFPFAGRDHMTARTLARAFSQNVSEAVGVIRDGQAEMWVRRALQDVERADAMVTAVETAKAHSDDALGSDDYLVCRVSITLDPGAPIRYKGFSFMPEGFGSALAVDILRHGAVQVPAEIIALAIPALWSAAPGRHAAGPDGRRQEIRRPAGVPEEQGHGGTASNAACTHSTRAWRARASSSSMTMSSPSRPSCRGSTRPRIGPMRARGRWIATSPPSSPSTSTATSTLYLRALSDPVDKSSSIGLLSLLALLQSEVDPDESVLGLSS